MNIGSLINLIKTKCELAVAAVYPELAKQIIEVTATAEARSNNFGDYQCNSAMKFSKILKKSPLEIANNLVTYLNQINNDQLIIFAEIKVAGPGFINFTISNKFLEYNLNYFIINKKFIWQDQNIIANNLSKVIVDFSSPNIAKEMHVGHLRSTIIGDCIARVLEFVGYQVLRINHLGDWGTQFGMLIAYLKNNNYLQNELNLNDLATYYKKSKVLFDQDINFKKQSQEEVVALQAKDPNSLIIWKKIFEISIKAYHEIYKILDIKITDLGESFYNPMLEQIVKDFTSKNLLTHSDGAECIYLEGFTGREEEPLPLIIKKSDGGYNYATTDLAALKYRVQQENASWIIYVTDSGQALHFAMIFAAAKKIGYLQANTILSHVKFGLVLRENGKKFKTREGDTIRLKDLIDEAIDKAKQLLLQRNSDLTALELAELSSIMGINAIKYADLSNNRNSDYIFDSDKMLQFNGNTAAFLSYAYVRINSIKNKISIDFIELMQNPNFKITEPEERKLALRVCRFYDVINNLVAELLPNRLTDYLYILAEEFHSFFHACKVSGHELQNSRLVLCEAVAKIMIQGFELLGLKVINKM